MCYTIYTTHGRGGGAKRVQRLLGLADMASIVDADIYIHSHTHLPMDYETGILQDRYSKQRGKVCWTSYLLNTAATLNYGGYGQTLEFKPASKDNPVILLTANEKEFTARL